LAQIQVLLDVNEQLRKENKELLERLSASEARVALLEAEVKDLRRQLKQNSQNSHRPPSSDGYSKKSAFPRKRGGKRGGKKGHKGKTLLSVSTPNYTTELLPPSVCHCGQTLDSSTHKVLGRCQVFDISQPSLLVYEYQQLGCCCPSCGQLHQGKYPCDVKSPVQYGSGVRSLAVLLNVHLNGSYQKISQLFADLFGSI